MRILPGFTAGTLVTIPTATTIDTRGGLGTTNGGTCKVFYAGHAAVVTQTNVGLYAPLRRAYGQML